LSNQSFLAGYWDRGEVLWLAGCVTGATGLFRQDQLAVPGQAQLITLTTMLDLQNRLTPHQYRRTYHFRQGWRRFHGLGRGGCVHVTNLICEPFSNASGSHLECFFCALFRPSSAASASCVFCERTPRSAQKCTPIQRPARSISLDDTNNLDSRLCERTSERRCEISSR